MTFQDHVFLWQTIRKAPDHQSVAELIPSTVGYRFGLHKQYAATPGSSGPSQGSLNTALHQVMLADVIPSFLKSWLWLGGPFLKECK